MTAQRRTLLLMIATLFVGILIGAFAVSLIHRMRMEPAGWRKLGKEAFVEKLMNVAEADSAQAREFRPLILEAMGRIDTLQMHTDREVQKIIDTLGTKSQKILRPEQLKKLEQFHKQRRPEHPR